MREDPAQVAVQDAADAIGEGLLKVAGTGDTDAIARAALVAGLQALTRYEPSPARVDKVAAAIYAAMHDTERAAWSDLDAGQQRFWQQIAAAAIQASDRGALSEIRGG